MTRLDLTLLENDGGSWDELKSELGIMHSAWCTGYPGALYEGSIDLNLYWPFVRPVWEEGERWRDPLPWISGPLGTCGVWREGRDPCSEPAVEVLRFLNSRMDYPGAVGLPMCVEHLHAYCAEALLIPWS